jgi:hypothetical protein
MALTKRDLKSEGVTAEMDASRGEQLTLRRDPCSIRSLSTPLRRGGQDRVDLGAAELEAPVDLVSR